MASPSTFARSLRILAIGMVVLGLGSAAWLYSEFERRQGVPAGGVTSTGTALVGGPFALTDQNGEARSEADFRGRHMLIYFGYTFCPDVCPTSLIAMTRALEQLEARAPALAERLVPLFISVDPERDTVEAMRAYAGHFHPRLVALTGDAAQVAAAAKAYRVYYRKAEEDASTDYLVDHSSFIYLMDGEGLYVTHFPHNATAEEIAERLAKLLDS